MKLKSHILMILSNPCINDARVLNEANSLSEAGYKVTLLCWDREGIHPEHDFLYDIEVIRIRNTRFMNFLTFDILRMSHWWKQAHFKALEIHDKNPLDAIHCHDLDTLPIGVELKNKLKIPLVYDSHELWPDMLSRDIPYIFPKRFAHIEKECFKSVDHLITTHDPFLDELLKRAGRQIPSTIVMNAKKITNTEYQKSPNSELIALYIGNLSKPRLVEGLIDAVSSLDGVKAIIGGFGKPSQFQKISNLSKSNPNVTFLGVVPVDAVLSHTLEADVVICMTDPNDKNNSRASANKQFEAMSCGRPIVCSNGTEISNFTNKHDIGISVEHSVDGIQGALIELRDNKILREEMGRKALSKACDEFNWEVQSKRLVAVYEGL